MTGSSAHICRDDPNIRPQSPANWLTTDELVLLRALVNVHIKQLGQLAKLETDATALQRLGRDQVEADRLRGKLERESVRIPGVTS